MLARLIAATALVALTTTAYAADNPSSNSTTTSTANQQSTQQSTQNLPQEIQAKLQQDGFTDVQVMPGSFLVTAKDKRGDPVTMVIGPHSMMVMTEAKMGSKSGMNRDNTKEGHDQK